jgi:hypothetical protein
MHTSQFERFTTGTDVRTNPDGNVTRPDIISADADEVVLFVK